MKKIIYLGMDNKPYEVFETAYVKNSRVVYQYENNNGKRVMLKATQNNNSYFPAYDHIQYVNNTLPICEKGKIYPIDILDKGYSGHYFKLIEA